jgi:hypothetical protein
VAGTIALSPERRWSAAGWLFDWVAEFTAREVGNSALAASIEEIVAENLGWMDVDGLPTDVRATVLFKLRDELVPTAVSELPASMPERERVLSHLRELAELAGASL